jgi:hypothetical protein
MSACVHVCVCVCVCVPVRGLCVPPDGVDEDEIASFRGGLVTQINDSAAHEILMKMRIAKVCVCVYVCLCV